MPPFFSTLHALAVNDRRRRTGFAPDLFTAFHIERVMNALQRAVPFPLIKIIMQCAARRQVLGIARHWQPVLRIYISPLTTSRTFTVRLLPPRLAGGMIGATCAHSASVKSLG